ncbi:MAG: hypothetical protein KIT87_17100 [Anaerolineae bacterium]|nr:hypothetical protein [Anaerolineae bacterium]
MLDEILRNSIFQTVVQVIVNFKNYLYLFAGLGALIALRAIWIARRERARALFGLEREAASDRLGQALFTFLVMGGLAGLVYFTVNYMTPDAVNLRLALRAQAQATATAQARATDSILQATTIARTPSPSPRPPTATPAPQSTNTPEPPRPPDITLSCHGEGQPLQMRYVDRQGVNLRRSPEFRNDNVDRIMQFSNEVCVYAEEQAGPDIWLKVTVQGIEGYRYILKSLTRE